MTRAPEFQKLWAKLSNNSNYIKLCVVILPNDVEDVPLDWAGRTTRNLYVSFQYLYWAVQNSFIQILFCIVTYVLYAALSSKVYGVLSEIKML